MNDERMNETLTAAQLINYLATAAAVESESDDVDRGESARYAALSEVLAGVADARPAELERCLELAVANGLDAPTGAPGAVPKKRPRCPICDGALDDGDVVYCTECGYEDDGEACPGCGCRPGDGLTAGCDHPAGCGFYR